MRRFVVSVLLILLMVACGKKAAPVVVPAPPDPFAAYTAVLVQAKKFADQTDTPRYTPSSGTHCKTMLDFLTTVAHRNAVGIENWPIQVLSQTFADPTQPAVIYGVTLHQRRQILVAVELPSCGRAETIAHELAHLLGSQGLHPNEEELAADLVQYGVLRELGYDTSHGTALYLSLHVNATPVTPQMRTWVMSTVERILKQ